MAILSGFLFGLLGSVHCAGMCGPLALALPAGGAGRTKYVLGRVLYNLGRVTTYAALGVVAGLVGTALSLAGAQQVLSVVLGFLILLMALLPLALKKFVPAFTLPARLGSHLQATLSGMMKKSAPLALFLIGLVNGLLPCGFVYIALAAAVTEGDVARGVMFMAGFGAGTVPMMLAIALMGNTLQTGIRRRLVALVPAFAGALGVLLILRGLNLGIPYISPTVAEDRPVQETHCH